MKYLITDPGILTGLQRGEQRAFLVFHQEYAVAVCLFVHNMIDDRAAAEDIATDSFVKTFERVHDFPDITKMKGFLYTTAYRKALDYLRSQHVRKQVHSELLQQPIADFADVERQYIMAETINAIHRAVERLPGNAREVIRKNIIEGKRSKK